MNKWEFDKLKDEEKQIIINDVKKLYCDDVLSDKEISKKLNIKGTLVRYIRYENNIKRKKEDIKKRREMTNLERFGVIHKNQLESNRQNLKDKWDNKTVEEKEQIKEHRKQTCLDKYGVENSWQSDITKEKIQETNIKKYGTNWYTTSDDFKEKAKQTSMNHYGVDVPFKSKDVQDKVKQTMKDKYNVENCSQLDFVKRKKEETCLKNYGVKCSLQNNEIRKKSELTSLKKYGTRIPSQSIIIKEKTKQANLKKFGVNYNVQQHISKETLNIINDKNALKQFIINNNIKTYYDLHDKLNDLSLSHIYKIPKKYNLEDMLITNYSAFENEIRDFLTSHNIKFTTNTRSIIKPLELDIYIPEYNVAIECNGTYWHSSIYKDANYHYNKSKLCESKNIRLIHVWEHEWNNELQRPILENIILSACGKIQNKIYARNCTIEVKDSKSLKSFFEQNNIQGFRGGKFAICLMHNNEIVMSYIFGHAHFGKGKYEIEVIRGATKLGYTIIGGASKIWKYFKDNYSYNNCVYYVDYNYFNGNSIKYLDENFEFIKTQPSFKNWWLDTNVIKNREPSKHKEIKELEKQGLIIPIYNAGTKVYVWKR